MAQLLQVEDAGGTRRNVGTATSAGDGAIRVIAPDSDPKLDGIKDAVDTERTTLAAKLDAVLAELQKKLDAATLKFVADALRVQIDNLPGNYPDAGAHTLLNDIATALTSTGVKINDASPPMPTADGAVATRVEQVRDRLPGALASDGGLKVHVQQDLATASGQTAIRDRLPSQLDADGGVKVHVQQSLATEVTADRIAARADVLASEVTVEAVRALLEELRNGQFRRTDPLAAGANFIGYTSNDLVAKIAAGKVFSAGNFHTFAAGTTGTFSLKNPAGSGKVLHVVSALVSVAGTTPLQLRLFEDSTITGGSGQTPWNMNRSSALAASATFTSGSGIRSGGVQLSAGLMAVRDRSFDWQGVLPLPPGKSLEVEVTVPGGLTGGDSVSCSVSWVEEAL